MVGAIVVAGRVFLQAAPDTGRATFTGRMTAGQNFSRTLSNGLLFCLNAEASVGGAGTPAWFVLVGLSCSPSADNFAAVVTPPFFSRRKRASGEWVC
jgi:hypothetical protein